VPFGGREEERGGEGQEGRGGRGGEGREGSEGRGGEGGEGGAGREGVAGLEPSAVVPAACGGSRGGWSGSMSRCHLRPRAGSARTARQTCRRARA
jgi:hypothetical protein